MKCTCSVEALSLPALPGGLILRGKLLPLGESGLRLCKALSLSRKALLAKIPWLLPIHRTCAQRVMFSP